MDDSYLSDAPDWYATWAAGVHAAGGICTRMPPGIATTILGTDEAGALAERYPDGNGGYTYKLAPLEVRLMDDADSSVADALLSFESGYESGYNAVPDAAQQLPAMISTATANVAKSFPWWVWLAAAVVAYGIGVQIGILPPLNKIARG